MASMMSPREAPTPAAAATDASSTALPELPLFVAKEVYVYRVPPATTVGHRAEMWDVNNWLATVSLKVLQADDDCFIRLLEEKTGELFAECPIPTDHRPLTTAVEPVIDSSRYFVLRIVDRDSQRHAFIGIGFRERSEASDFNATLHEFLQYIRRKRTAKAMRHAYEERVQLAAAEAGAQGQGDAVAAAQLADYSIKDGETLRLKLSAPKAATGGFVSRAAARGHLGKTFSLIMDGHGGSMAALLPPPRPGSSPRLDMCVSPSLEADGGSPIHTEVGGGMITGASPAAACTLGRLGCLSGSRDGELHQRLQRLHLQSGGGGGETSGPASCSASIASTSTSAAAAMDDDFGDFEEADSGQVEEQQQQKPEEDGQVAG